MEKQMSGGKKADMVWFNTKPYTDYINYLKGYDTSNVDTTLGNLTDYASSASKNLGDLMGNYTFNVNASDEARQQAQDAVYNQYMNRLQPQFEQQTSDLATSLANKGLSVGSEAYQRAMNDLQQEQNDATSQAAYQSVLAGQQAYSQDLQNQIAAGSFGNNAQQAYINQLLSALTRSQSGYENQQNIFGVESALANIQYQQAQALAAQKAANSGNSGLGSTIGSLAGAGLGLYLGGPVGAGVGAQLGGTVGGMFG